MSNGLCEEGGYPTYQHIDVVRFIEVFADGENIIIVECPNVREEFFEEWDSGKEGENPNDDDGPNDTDNSAD